MKKLISCILLVLFACGKEKEVQLESTYKTRETVKVSDIDYSLYPIRQGGLGHISIGMRLEESRRLITGLREKQGEAFDFGFDGGGKAYIYSKEDEPIFALIPNQQDTLIAIIALNSNLKTSNGLHSKMTVKELMAFYPGNLHVDEMMGWEYIPDEENGWSFVFSSGKKTDSHENMSKSSNRKHENVLCDWITIKATGKCSGLRNGKFSYKDANGKDVLVHIENDVCTEQHNNGKYILISKINWITDCEYENTLVMTTLPDFPFNPGTKMYVSIDRVEGEKYYFSAAINGKLYKNVFTRL